MVSTVLFGAGVALVVILALLLAWAMRGKWDLLMLHASDMVRHGVAVLLLIGTSVGSLWFYSFGRVVLGGGAEVLVNSGGITVAVEVAALIAASYVARLDLLTMATKGKERDDWARYRRKVLAWFYVTVGCSVVANVIFRINTYGPGNLDPHTWTFWYTMISAVFAGCVPVVLVNVLLIVLRKLPIQYTQRLQHKAQIGYAATLDVALKSLNREIHAAVRGEEFNSERVGRLRTTFAFVAPFLGESAHDISHALTNLLPAHGGTLALPDGGQYFDKTEVMELWGVPERTAQDWIGRTQGARKRAGTRRMEAPASALYQAYGVPSNVAGRESKPPRRIAQSRDSAQNRAESRNDVPEYVQAEMIDAQHGAGEVGEEAQRQTIEAQPVAG